MKQNTLLFVIFAAFILQSCAPDQRCYRDEECDAPMVCKRDGTCDYICYRNHDCGTGFICKDHQCAIDFNPDPCANGSCTKPECENDNDCKGELICKNQKCTQPEIIHECETDEDCHDDWVCKDNYCVEPEKPPIPTCPEGMALIENTYCMDKYEASRPDATASNAGSNNSKAVSRAGVMPWNIGDNNAAAEAACQAAGKRLCTPAEWEFSCHGINNTVYGYGDTYNPTICNGLDTYGRSNFHLMPTGSFPNCNNGWDVYDLSGNLWEHTAGGDGKKVRGGAFNCVDSEGNHKCSYIPQRWTPLSIGFRCCASPITSNEEPQANHIDFQNISPRLPELYQNDFFSGHEVLIAWNDSSTDTATDAVHYLASNDTNDQELEREITVDAAQILGLSTDNTIDTPCIEPNDFIYQAQSLWNNPDTARDAVKLLKDARKCHPDNTDIQRALGIAYTMSENYPWALKTFSKIASDNDCETQSWIAWTYLQMGMTDEVSKLYKSSKCDQEYLTSRMQLVESLNALSQADSTKAKRILQNVYESPELSKNDSDALNSLQNMAGLTHNPNMTWKVEIDGGYATNALSGSPNDPRLMNKKTGSAFLDGQLRLMIDPWKNAFSRVVFEGQVDGQFLFADDAKDSSYLDVSFRPGIVLDWDNIKFGTYYRPEFLILKGGDIYDDGPLLTYFSHRLELDVELYKWLYIFVGYGHRTFRQRVRTRDEIDIGAGGHHPLGYGLALTWGATYRHWFSTGDMYDLNGTNVSIALDYKIIDILFRLNGSFAFDDYADSKGYFDAQNARRDYLVRGTFNIWSPSFAGIRVGAQVKTSRRWSTADDYDYTDYRALLAIRWTGDLDFYAPHTISDNYTSLPWNLDNAGSAERIRDIIQQDEDLQRSSSCLQN